MGIRPRATDRTTPCRAGFAHREPGTGTPRESESPSPAPTRTGPEAGGDRGLLPVGPQGGFEQWKERRQIFFDRAPQRFEVDFRVAVNETVSHSDNVGPGNVWIARLLIPGNARSGLSDDLHEARQSELENPIFGKVLPSPSSSQCDCLARGVQHVSKSNPGFMLRHAASALL
jgi:hypothetical protein